MSRGQALRLSLTCKPYADAGVVDSLLESSRISTAPAVDEANIGSRGKRARRLLGHARLSSECRARHSRAGGGLQVREPAWPRLHLRNRGPVTPSVTVLRSTLRLVVGDRGLGEPRDQRAYPRGPLDAPRAVPAQVPAADVDDLWWLLGTPCMSPVLPREAERRQARAHDGDGVEVVGASAGVARGRPVGAGIRTGSRVRGLDAAVVGQPT